MPSPKKPKFKKRQLLVVEWLDASHYSSWKDAERCIEDSPMLTRTVGWKVPSAKGCITIASSHTELDDVSGRDIIPRKYIVSIRKLE